MSIVDKNIFNAVEKFSNEDVAIQHMRESHFMPELKCPRCGGRDLGYIATRKVNRCKSCRYPFSAKTGTLMHGSHLPIGKWMSAIWLLSNSKGMTTVRLTDLLEVTQLTAWKMCNRINKVSDDLEASGRPAPARYIPWFRSVSEISEFYPYSLSPEDKTNAIIKSVYDMVSKECPISMRSDVTQELLLRIFSGAIRIENARDLIPEIRKDNWLYAEKFHSHVSLDAPVYEDGASLAETLLFNMEKNFLGDDDEEEGFYNEEGRACRFGQVVARY